MVGAVAGASLGHGHYPLHAAESAAAADRLADNVENLELTDLDVYWTLTGQLLVAVLG